MGKPNARHEGFSRPGDPPAPGLKPRHVWEGSWPLQWIAPPQGQKETWVASCACLGSGPPLLFPSGKWAPCEAVSLVPENVPVEPGCSLICSSFPLTLNNCSGSTCHMLYVTWVLPHLRLALTCVQAGREVVCLTGEWTGAVLFVPVSPGPAHGHAIRGYRWMDKGRKG